MTRSRPWKRASRWNIELPSFDLTLQFLPTDFVQVNGPLNLQMIDRRGGAAGARSPMSRVLDLFCGLGNFSLPLARRAGRSWAWKARPALVGASSRSTLREMAWEMRSFSRPISPTRASAHFSGLGRQVRQGPARSAARRALKKCCRWSLSLVPTPCCIFPVTRQPRARRRVFSCMSTRAVNCRPPG